MNPGLFFSKRLVAARLVVAAASMLALAAPASAGSMTAHKDAETNDRAADVRAIYAIEDRTEAIAEGEKAGAAAVTAGQKSVAKWPALRAMLADEGAPATDLTAMDVRVKRLASVLHDPVALERAANDVTGALAPLFAVLGESTPADVHRLDYLGRSLGLDATMAQWHRAGRDAYALDRAWLHLKTLVASKPNSAKTVAMFDSAVRAARDGAHDRNAKETQSGATAVGNAVDAVEGLYK